MENLMLLQTLQIGLALLVFTTLSYLPGERPIELPSDEIAPTEAGITAMHYYSMRSI